MEDAKKSAKVCVYAKAQNRTALGIVHAYMQMRPSATIEDLRKAFPNSLNPDSGVKENFIYAEEESCTANWNGYFKSDEELITTGDGKKIAVVSMWTKASVERIIAQANAYGITAVKLDAIDKENHKRGFYWEYVNGYLPSKPTNAKPKFWLLALLGVLAVLSALFFIFLR